MHDHFCAFRCGLGANLDYIVTAQNGFEHGPLRNMYGKSMGFKASGVMLSRMLCKSRFLDRSTGCCAVACSRPQQTHSCS